MFSLADLAAALAGRAQPAEGSVATLQKPTLSTQSSPTHLSFNSPSTGKDLSVNDLRVGHHPIAQVVQSK
jgi:hypothetical protein